MKYTVIIVKKKPDPTFFGHFFPLTHRLCDLRITLNIIIITWISACLFDPQSTGLLQERRFRSVFHLSDFSMLKYNSMWAERESFIRWIAFCFRNNAIYALLLYRPSFVHRKCRANVRFLFKKISHTPSSGEIGLKIIVFVPVEKITLLDRFIRCNITRHCRYKYT